MKASIPLNQRIRRRNRLASLDAVIVKRRDFLSDGKSDSAIPYAQKSERSLRAPALLQTNGISRVLRFLPK